MNNFNPSKHTDKYKYFIAFLALFIIPISGLSIDIYVPSLPVVSQYFHASHSLTQFSVTAYMIGIGFMQLFSGGISDTFGRRNPFLYSMSIFIIATLFIPFSLNIYMLILLRFIQGITVALMIVPIRSIIPDLFQGKELYKMMTYVTTAWSIGPIIAPAIGGYLQSYFGWKANFYFLAIYSMIGWVLIYKWLPETSQYRHPFEIKGMYNRYKEMYLNADYTSGLIVNSLLYSFMILFSVVTPFLIQSVMHYSAVQFGHIALLIGLAWFMGTLTNRFTMHISADKKAIVLFSSMLVVAIIMTILAMTAQPSVINITLPMFVLAWLGGTIFPNNFAHSVALFPNATGGANALFSATVFIISGVSSALGGFLITKTALPLTLAYVFIIATCLMICCIRQHQKQASLASVI